ncbi:hypothetical protein [Pseudomonas asiatica]|uniref:hypothetical protein n=1 Tax=Pseudomonas asiatica TaxID=2219225 RepID=UPI00174AFACA|nr:hypothetical protein [Pseudomonas asiatica]QOE10705.1 hypothetical protein IE322_11880 [Pseudomonas asiatica]
MSSKINVLGIIKGHISTLSDPQGRISFYDIITFFFFPGVAAFVSILSRYNLNKDVSSMLVNFGAIFTALLLSVLVLVYDQESKLRSESRKEILTEAKILLLTQLYYNICFSIVSSLWLIFLCLVHSMIDGVVKGVSIGSFAFTVNFALFLVTPVVVFVVVNLMLTILMVVKRMHAMLTLR